MYTASQWRKLYEHKFLHWVFVFAGMSQHNIEPDELHVLYLGVVMYAIGSVLWLLVFELLPGSPEENMRRAWGDVSALYTAHHVTTQ